MLFLFIQFSHPVASWPTDDADLPAISWSKNLESGFISTSPLIADGVIVFKTPQGLNALGIEGETLWSTTHESFFELSPLVHLGRQSSHQCEGYRFYRRE